MCVCVCVCVKSLGLSVYKIMSSANRQFSFFLSNLYAFYLFFLCNALTRTSGSVLNRNGEKSQSCFVLQLIGKAFSSSLLHIMLSIGFTGSSAGKESACSAGDPGSIPGWEDPLEKVTASHSSIPEFQTTRILCLWNSLPS